MSLGGTKVPIALSEFHLDVSDEASLGGWLTTNEALLGGLALKRTFADDEAV